jgi:hypothetical protein
VNSFLEIFSREFSKNTFSRSENIFQEFLKHCPKIVGKFSKNTGKFSRKRFWKIFQSFVFPLGTF